MTLRQRLIKRDLLIGTWFVTPSPALADIICSSGIDFLIIDREHGSHSFETVMTCALAAKANDVHSIVRCTDILQAEILRCLDTGVEGLQVPNVVTADQLEDVLSFALYPPEGTRGYSVFTRNGRYGAIEAAKLPKKANDETALIINLENALAAENMNVYLRYDRVDGYFIGLYDLSKSLGAPGDFQSPQFLKCVETITRACAKAGKSVGTICNDLQAAERYRNMGMNYLVYSVDCNVIRGAYQSFVEQMQRKP